MFKKNLVNLAVVLSLLLSLGLGVANAAPPAQAELTYTVKLGDNLWTLAEKYLGSGPAYHAIVLATNAKNAEDSSFASIADPGLIHPGWKFLIPSAEEADDLMVAMREGSKFKVGMVSDVGGIDDASFNENTWKGLADAADAFGITATFLESQAQADYENNITEFAEQGYDMIITVGFLLGDATYKMAAEYPGINFAIVDFPSGGEETPNLQGILFNVDEASVPVGYVAAAMADQLDPEGPAVGVIGGMQIPPVEQFIIAYEAGTNYYNQKYGKDVGFELVYVGEFEAPDKGKVQAHSLIDEGVDIIMGVGGKTGNGGITAAKERGKWGVGVDVDQYYTLPNEKDILVTSTVKRLDKAVFAVIKSMLVGKFAGGTNYIATLANQGVGVAPFHDFEDKVPDSIKADIEQMQKDIMAGALWTGWGEEPVAYGTEDNPIIWSFVPSGEMERVAAGAESVADLIYEETGLVIETNVATEYAGVIEAMCADPPKAHMASLATFSYVLAAGKGCAAAELVSVRYGSPTYNGQFIVRADSGIESIADLEGKTFCRPDPLSTSGWIIPMLTMRAAGIDTDTDLAEVVDAGSHDAVASSVYNGDCDAGATYVDARTRIEEDYPDVMDQVVVIALTEDIPNDGVQYQASFPRALRDQINAALLKIAETEEGQEALDTAYQWAGLMEVDDTFYDPFRQVLSASGLDIEELLD
jgi:phosphate/phosphite/phosphonate ABC transporter binding protein